MKILNTVLINDSTLVVAAEAVISPRHVGPSSRLEVFRGFLPQPWIFWFLSSAASSCPLSYTQSFPWFLGLQLVKLLALGSSPTF